MNSYYTSNLLNPKLRSFSALYILKQFDIMPDGAFLKLSSAILFLWQFSFMIDLFSQSIYPQT